MEAGQLVGHAAAQAPQHRVRGPGVFCRQGRDVAGVGHQPQFGPEGFGQAVARLGTGAYRLRTPGGTCQHGVRVVFGRLTEDEHHGEGFRAGVLPGRGQVGIPVGCGVGHGERWCGGGTGGGDGADESAGESLGVRRLRGDQERRARPVLGQAQGEGSGVPVGAGGGDPGKQDGAEVPGGCPVVAFLDDVLEAAVRQQRGPLIARQQERVRPQLRVTVTVETLQRTEDRGQGLGVVRLDGEQGAARCQKGGDPVEGGSEVLGRVEGVGRDHDVEAVRGESLLGGVRVQVEGAVVEEVVGAEPGFRTGEEDRRDVAEAVAGAVRGQHGQQGRGGAAGARSDLQYAQRPVGRPGPDHFTQQGLGEPVGEPAVLRGVVELLQGPDRGVVGQQFHRILAPSQHLRQALDLLRGERLLDDAGRAGLPGPAR